MSPARMTMNRGLQGRVLVVATAGLLSGRRQGERDVTTTGQRSRRRRSGDSGAGGSSGAGSASSSGAGSSSLGGPQTIWSGCWRSPPCQSSRSPASRVRVEHKRTRAMRTVAASLIAGSDQPSAWRSCSRFAVLSAAARRAAGPVVAQQRVARAARAPRRHHGTRARGSRQVT